MPKSHGNVGLRDFASAFLVLTALTTGPAAGLTAPPPDDDPEELAAGVVVRFSPLEPSSIVVSQTAADLAWDWGNAMPDARLSASGFQFSATGSLLIQSPGQYRFYVRSDGPATLSVNGVAAFDGTPEREKTVPVELRPGFTPWALSYRHDHGPARLAVDWEGPDFAREPVPARLLYHDPKDSPPPDRFEEGRRLADRLGCANCHSILDFPRHPALGPPLADVTRLTDHAWLNRWLKDPTVVRPGSRMPGFGSTPGLAQDAVDDLTAFLTSKAAGTAQTAEVKMALNVAQAEQGRLLFRSLGCLGCHGRGEPLGQEPLIAPDLNDVGRKRTPDMLAAYLEHPRSGKVPSRHRPDLRLTGDESANLAAYLTEGRKGLATREDTPTGMPERGRLLSERLRCASCHEIPGVKAPEARIPLRAGSRADAGCLADLGAPRRVDVPRFALSDGARGALRAFVSGLPDRPGPTDPGTFAHDVLRRRNCLGCHVRDGRGGSELAGRLATLLGEDRALGGLKGTMTPPNLTAVGDKLRPEYLALAVRGGAPTARPWLSVRMPVFAFEAGEADAIAAWFRAHDRMRAADVEPPPAAPVRLEASDREASARLIGQRGFGCVSCHVLAGRIPPGGEPETLGPDLALAHRRMTERYFRRWIADPQRVIAGTPMPQFLKPIDGLSGKLDDQLSSVWRLLGSDSLAEVAAAGTRVALRREGDRALVVRDMVLIPELPDTPYTPRGLAIGLKNNASLLFDTDRLTWLAAWRGGFLYRTKSGRLWEWHPEGTPLWAVAKRLPPVVLIAPNGSAEGPVETRERFGTFRFLEFTGDGVRLAYRLDFRNGPLDVTEEIQPRAQGWVRSVRVAAAPAGFVPAIVEQPGSPPGEFATAEWPVGPDRVLMRWSSPSRPRPPLPGAPGAVVTRLQAEPAGGFGGSVVVEMISGH